MDKRRLHVERVKSDPEFWRLQCFPKLKSFYYNIMLPAEADPGFGVGGWLAKYLIINHIPRDHIHYAAVSLAIWLMSAS